MTALKTLHGFGQSAIIEWRISGPSSIGWKIAEKLQNTHQTCRIWVALSGIDRFRGNRELLTVVSPSKFRVAH